MGKAKIFCELLQGQQARVLVELGGPSEVLEVGEGEGMGVLPSAITTSPPRVGTGCLLARWGAGCAQLVGRLEGGPQASVRQLQHRASEPRYLSASEPNWPHLGVSLASSLA